MSYCFICAEPNPCDEHKYIAQARRDQLNAANKAIVALSEALDGLVNESLGHDMPGTVWRPFAETLTTHADTIKRAKEST